jgi:hypothetical protein
MARLPLAWLTLLWFVYQASRVCQISTKREIKVQLNGS